MVISEEENFVFLNLVFKKINAAINTDATKNWHGQ